jgi:hypothetical protein
MPSLSQRAKTAAVIENRSVLDGELDSIHMAQQDEPAKEFTILSEEQSSEASDNSLQLGVDYYFENDLMVFTSEFLLKRGYCCERGCRHCPFG